jgi:hypothetical protein
MTLTLDTVVTVPDNLLFSNLGGEEVILDLSTGTYYGLNEVGARVWALIETPRSGHEICDRLEAEYDVDRPSLERDVLHLLQEFEAEGLLEVDARASA